MLGHFYGPYRSFTMKNQWTYTKWCNNIVYLAPTDFQNAVKIIKNITLNAKQKSLTEFLTFLKNITRKSISKLDRVTNFRLLRSTETSLLIGWNLPMSLENNRHAFHNLRILKFFSSQSFADDPWSTDRERTAVPSWTWFLMKIHFFTF